MAKLNGNDAYLSINGVNVSAYWTSEISPELSVEGVDTTAGSGQEYKQRQIGLKDYSLKLTLVYPTDFFVTVVQPVLESLVDGTYPTVIYGPEGMVTGKPKSEFKAMTDGIKSAQSIEKEMVSFELKLMSVDTPTALVELGGVF